MWTVMFWIMVVGLAFLLALAVQMRMMIAHVLRKAVMAHDGGLDVTQAAALVAAAAGAESEAGAGDRAARARHHLRAVYPRPLGHLRIARRACLVLPALLLAVFILRRLLNGGI